ncbi:SDR family oxidoreductase [Burkholderiaceae bacterium DAT-1]|nr:SDR family oxidoreductase [Burkholderiaceae bacterium DAT-1]
MHYFVTGGTGFIGKRLIHKLLQRRGSVVYFLVRKVDEDHVAELREGWGVDAKRAIPVVGDLTAEGLAVAAAQQSALVGKIDHFFHLAAIYDLRADAESQIRVNVEGTRNVIRFAESIQAKRFHHFSSIAAAGLYNGVFREDMFAEATGLENPYLRTKHDSEGVVRKECTLPWRIYRPGMVVGDSQTGEMDKIDGPYYFFKLIQKTRRMLPSWVPMIGLDGGRLNIVPVDFVVNATDHIAHAKGEDGKCFHLTDPQGTPVGDVLQIFAKAAHAPTQSLKINAGLFQYIPRSIKSGMLAITPIRRIRDAILRDLGLPADIFGFLTYPTRYDNRETMRVLKGSGISVPRLEDYAWRLWDYWERNLDPALHLDRSLEGTLKGKVVAITGASSGIGKAAAIRLLTAGATVVTIARDAEKLELARAELAELGLTLHCYQGDLSNADDCARFVEQVNADHGGVDVLINNAGRSIRRAIEASFDRFHDFERTMQLNYFGSLRLTMGVLPGMIERKRGHIINISSIGVLTNAPRFSAYVASKAAMDAWTRCAAAEFCDRHIEFTTINMPLVKTPMIAPTKLYNNVPTLTPEDAADMIAEAVVYRPVRIATRLGIFGAVVHAFMPRVAQIIMNTSFRMFPDSDAAKHRDPNAPHPAPTADQIALSTLMQGIHF